MLAYSRVMLDWHRRSLSGHFFSHCQHFVAEVSVWPLLQRRAKTDVLLLLEIPFRRKNSISKLFRTKRGPLNYPTLHDGVDKTFKVQGVLRILLVLIKEGFGLKKLLRKKLSYPFKVEWIAIFVWIFHIHWKDIFFENAEKRCMVSRTNYTFSRKGRPLM